MISFELEILTENGRHTLICINYQGKEKVLNREN